MYKCIIVLLFCFECVENELLNSYKGASCTWQGLNGKCVNIFRCRSAMENLKKRNFPPICAFEGKEPVICCTDCDFEEDTRNVIYDPYAGLLIKTGSKIEEKCYDFLQLDYPCKKYFTLAYDTYVESFRNCNSLLISYKTNNTTLFDLDAVKDHIPHMAYLGYGERETAIWLCAGSIISSKFILTAAQCVNPDVSSGKVRFIAVGINKRWVSPSVWQRHDVKRSIVHPEYKPPSKYHDIALLETVKEITFGSDILPACLYLDKPGVDSKVKAVIWSEGVNSTLEYVTLSSFAEDQCSIYYPPQRELETGYNDTIQMCIGDKQKPEDTCDGEIGSPLQSAFKYCIQMVRGVASFKRQCGEAGGSWLYTRVSYYVPWIESIVWP